MAQEITSVHLIFVFSVLMGLLFVFIFYQGLRRTMSNPCWDEVVKGLDGAERVGKQGTLVLDDSCVNKIVFTTSAISCKEACGEMSEDDKKKDCLSFCTDTGDRTTFIVGIPAERPWLFGADSRIVNGLTKDWKWFFIGNAVVKKIPCIVGLEPVAELDECEEKGYRVECVPGKEEASYDVRVTESGSEGSCDIEVV